MKEQAPFTISKDNRAIPGIKRLTVAEHKARSTSLRHISGVWIVEGIPYNTARLREVTDMLEIHKKDEQDFELLNRKINNRAKALHREEILQREGVIYMSAENGKNIGAAKIGPGAWDLARQQPRITVTEQSIVLPRSELVPVEQRPTQGETLAQMAAEKGVHSQPGESMSHLPEINQNGTEHTVYQAPTRKVRVW